MTEHFTSKIFKDMRDAFGTMEAMGNQSSAQFKALVESKLADFNLVTREEYDAQRAVLMRTREKVEALEKTVAALESQLQDKPQGG